MSTKKPRTMLDEEGAKDLPPDYPVNPDLTSDMTIDIAVNREGDVWAFHDSPLPGPLEWVEYNVDTRRLVFVTKGGRLNDFGIEIGDLMNKYLKKADEMATYLIKDKKIHDFAIVPVIVQGGES